MKKVLAVVAVLALVASAQAGISVRVETAGTVTTAGGQATQYDVYLDADTSAEAVAAVDIVFSDGAYQGWYAGKVPTETPTDEDAVTWLWNPAIDSNFYPTFTAVVTAADEYMDVVLVAGDANNDMEGHGGLSVSAGIVVAEIVQQLKLARIVVLDSDPNGYALLNGSVADGQGAKTYYDDVIIPEPASMLLLAVGGLGVLARRRRR